MRAIAASVRGVDGIGTNGQLYHYPGPYGTSWKLLDASSAVALAATRSGVHVLDKDGRLWVVAARGGTRSLVKDSGSWGILGIFGGLNDRLYVSTHDGIFVLSGKRLTLVAEVSEPAFFAVRRSGELFWGSKGGSLGRVFGEQRTQVDAPGAVTAVAVNDKSLAIVSDGKVWRTRDAGWETLPDPVTHRTHRMQTRAALDVALSEHTLWVRDSGGFVHMLAEG